MNQEKISIKNLQKNLRIGKKYLVLFLNLVYYSTRGFTSYNKGNKVKKMENNSTKLIKILNRIPDIRQQSKVLHSLVDIIFIAIVATA